MADDSRKPDAPAPGAGRARRTRRRTSSPLPIVVALAVPAVLVLAAVGLYLSLGREPAGRRKARGPAGEAAVAEAAVQQDEEAASPAIEEVREPSRPAAELRAVEEATGVEELREDADSIAAEAAAAPPEPAAGRGPRLEEGPEMAEVEETARTGAPSSEPYRAGDPVFEAVPYIEPGPVWDRFLILIWQYKTDVRKDLPLYRQVNLRGFHIDRGAGRDDLVTFARENDLPYYVDHAADKGILHLTDRTGKKTILRKRTVVARPHSLADPKTIDLLKGHLRRNIQTTRQGPVVAYAFDDEVSLGSFTSPAEVDGSPRSVAAYRRWLEREYGTIDELNRTWGTGHGDFSQVRPVSFEDVRRRHVSPPILEWNLASWMDWRSYMDSQFAGCLAELTRYANSLDPRTPAGFVGGQQPAPYGGFDYSKISRAMQWIEAYDIGGSCEIVRSLWGIGPERRPYVQTWFSTGEARRDAWFLWYYLLHGNRGVIAWPDRDGSWFHHKDGEIAEFLRQNADTIREVQGDLSKVILDLETRFDADPIALYYSHPSVQASWVMDVVTHGGTWPNRSSSLDSTCQSAGKNRVAWAKLLEDCGFQYNIVTPGQVLEGELLRRKYKVLVLCRAVAMSDAELEAVRAFAQQGGTVIADHLTALLTEHGVGRRERGGLDDMFGIVRDEGRGYLGGEHITEIDGELYNKPFMERLKYERALRHAGIVIYERGTRAEAGRAGASVVGASVVVRSRVGKGRACYLNLTPVAYYDMNQRLGVYGETWRKLLTGLLAESGLAPRARVLSGSSRGKRPVPLAELVYWRRGKGREGDRLVVGLVKNPTRQGSITGVGQIHGVTGKPIDIRIVFRQRVKDVVDLRTGRKLPSGTTIRARWKPWEALLFEVSLP